jgi:dipeptidyl aminopeptidase/acylaminoacyl peptidase
MRRVMLLVGALAVAASAVLLAGASGGSALGAWGSAQDGWIAFTRVGPYPCGTGGRNCPSSIYVARTDGTGVRPMTTLCPGGAEGPVWSPDGTKIADTCIDYRFRDAVYLVNANGGGGRWLPADSFDPAWSPDGRAIAFSHPYPTGGIWIENVDGSHLRRVPGTRAFGLTRSAPEDKDWSPDGKQLVFEAHGQNADGIYRINLDGSGLKLLVRGMVFQPRWSPDGKSILFIRNVKDIYRVGRGGGVPKLVHRSPRSSNGVWGADWSPDGTQIGWAAPDVGFQIIDLRSGRDHQINLRPNVCQQPFACESFDWQGHRRT